MFDEQPKGKYFNATDFASVEDLNRELDQHRIIDLRNTSPQEIQPTIKARIDEAFNSAPVVDLDSGEFGYGVVGLNTIALKMPEDSHLYPLAEKIIFGKLMGLRETLNPKEAVVNERILMHLDPQIPNLMTKVFPGYAIRGETLLEHEKAHADSVKEQTGEDSYVFLSFIWARTGTRKEFFIYNHGGGITIEGTSPEAINNILLAPRNPSSGDYKNLKPGSTFRNAISTMITSLVGAGIATISENKLLGEWKKQHPLRKVKINLINFQQASKVRKSSTSPS